MAFAEVGATDIYVRPHSLRHGEPCVEVLVKVDPLPGLLSGCPLCEGRALSLLADRFAQAFARLEQAMQASAGTALEGFKYINFFAVEVRRDGEVVSQVPRVQYPEALTGGVPDGMYLKFHLLTEEANDVASLRIRVRTPSVKRGAPPQEKAPRFGEEAEAKGMDGIYVCPYPWRQGNLALQLLVHIEFLPDPQPGRPFYENWTPTVMARNFADAFERLERAMEASAGTVLEGFKYLDDFRVIEIGGYNQLYGGIPSGLYFQLRLVRACV